MNQSTGCPDCFGGAMSMQQKRKIVTDEARTYAKKEQKDVVIVPENGGFNFYTAEYAASAGLTTIDFISRH